MRNLSRLIGPLFLMILLAQTPLLASDDYPNVKTIRTEILKLVDKPDLEKLAQPTATVRLSFVVNNDKELIVINAEADVSFLKEYVKTKLNQQQLNTEYVRLNKIYYLDLIFKK